MKKIDFWKNAILEKMENSRIWDIVNESVDFPYKLLSSVGKGNVSVNRYLCPNCFGISEVKYKNYSSDSVECKHCGFTASGEYCFTSNMGKAYWKGTKYWDRIAIFGTCETINETDGILYLKTSEVSVTYDEENKKIRSSHKVIGYGFLSADIKFEYYLGKFTKARINNGSWRSLPVFLSETAKKYLRVCKVFSDGELNNGDVWLLSELQERAGINRKPTLSLYEKKAIKIMNDYPLCDVKELPEIQKEYLTFKLTKCDNINDEFKYSFSCRSCGKSFSRTFRQRVYTGNKTVTCKHCGKGNSAVELGGSLLDDCLYIEKMSDTVVALRLVRVWTNFLKNGEKTVNRSEVERMYFNLDRNGDWNCIHLSTENGPWKLKRTLDMHFVWNVETDKIIILPDAENVLKYTGFTEYIEERKKGLGNYENTLRASDLYQYLYSCTKTSCLEKLIKLGWAKICESVAWKVFYDEGCSVNIESDSLIDILGLPKRLIKKLSEYDNPDIEELKRIQAFYRIDNDVMNEDLDWCKEHTIAPREIGDITHILGISIHQACEYLERVRISQCYAPKSAIIEWFDYLNASKNIEADLSDKTVRYPSSLKREHDRATFKFKIVQDEKKEEIFQSACTDYGSKLSFEDDYFMITAPSSMQDLFEEGRKLNHCVGSYADRICEGRTCICFIRRKMEPDRPYFTVEVNPVEMRVRQIHGLSNRDVDKRRDKDLYLFLKHWAKKKCIDISAV